MSRDSEEKSTRLSQKMPTQDKILTVLGAFTFERPRLTLSQIARSTGFPLSTTHRLVDSLTAWGALERDEQGHYVIGWRMWEVGVLSPHSFHQRVRVVPLLERLFLAIGEQVVLSAFHPGGDIVVEQILGWRESDSSAGLGERLPLHASSPGLILLAFGDPKLWTEINHSSLRQYTSSTISDLDGLKNAVLEARRTRLAVSESAFLAGTSSMSSPVFGSGGGLYGAVSVVWSSGAADIARLAPMLAETAAGISSALRGRGEESLPRPVRRAAFGRGGTSLPPPSKG